MTDKEKRAEFAERIRETEAAARQLARPWKAACATLAVALVAVLLYRR